MKSFVIHCDPTKLDELMYVIAIRGYIYGPHKNL